MIKERILCFGDSYTWGYIPGSDHERFPDDVRFPKVLQSLLGANYEVIEEGLNSRTLVSEDTRPGKEGRSASNYLIPCLDTHDPLDLVVVMLGTNELKHAYDNSPQQIGDLFEQHILRVILNRKSQFRDTYPQVLIMTLPVIDETKPYAAERYVGGTQKARELRQIYEQIAETNHCHVVNASELAVGIDGVHLTKESHLQLAQLLHDKIVSLKL